MNEIVNVGDDVPFATIKKVFADKFIEVNDGSFGCTGGGASELELASELEFASELELTVELGGEFGLLFPPPPPPHPTSIATTTLIVAINL